MGKDLRKELKELLLEKCFRLGRFTLASGRVSDYYIDGRIASLDPRGAYLIANLFLRIIKRWKATAVGGLTLGADPIIGAVISLSYEKKYAVRGFIVRKESKVHGTGKLVEGIINNGDRVVIIEDVTTAGTSVRESVGILKAAVAPPNRVDFRALVVSVDRMERGQTERSALAEIAEAFLVRTFAIVTLDEVVEHLHGREVDGRVVLTGFGSARRP